MSSLFVGILFVLLSYCHAQLTTHWKVTEFPNPLYQVEECGRPADLEKSWICDPNGIIPQQDVDAISVMIKDIHEKTRCNCEKCIRDKNGYVIMIALMPRMYRLVNASNDIADIFTDARIYSYYLSMYWGTFLDCDQLVLILVSRDDGVVYTLTQKDAREKLTDTLVRQITLENQKYFDGKDRTEMGMGVKALVEQYGQVLRGQRQ